MEKTTMGTSKRKATQISQITTSTAIISDLPNHITSDILSRLPLSSVFACKRVCKPWRDLTLEPDFAKSHLPRSPPSLIFYRIGTKSPSHFEILQLHDPPALGHPTATVKFKTEIHSPRMPTELVASCNGSILLSNSLCNDVIVFNLLRAQRFVLPKPPKWAPKAHNFVSLGFGHSPSTDRYKVLRLTYTPGPARLCCDIYTIGIDDRWRSIGDTGQPPAFIISQIILLNGALRWIGDGNSRFIYYFDVEKEQFGSFPLPSHIESSCDCLGVVDNRLYLHDELSVDEWKVWTMKDYGDFGSWILEWVIERPVTHWFAGSHKPLKTFGDGSLLMMFSGLCPRINVMKTTLASYNPQTRVLEEIKYHGVLLWGASVAYVPCLCSPMAALK